MTASSFAAARRILLGEGKKPAELRKAYYLCGSERYLVEDMIDTIKRVAGAAVQDRMSIDAGEVSAAEVWAAITQYPLAPEARRLVIVRSAQDLKDWSVFERWVSDRDGPKVCVVFVSEEHEPDVEQPHLSRLLRQGGLVRCRPLSSRDAMYYVRSLTGCSAVEAGHLLERCAGEVIEVRDAALKMRYLNTMAPEAVDQVVPPGRDAGFVDHLVAGRKPEACEALSRGVELGAAVGRLNDRLERLSRLQRAYKRGDESVFGLSKNSGLSTAQVVLLRPHARSYSPDRLERCAGLLWVADEHLQQGVTDGVGEMVAALW